MPNEAAKRNDPCCFPSLLLKVLFARRLCCRHHRRDVPSPHSVSSGVGTLAVVPFTLLRFTRRGPRGVRGMKCQFTGGRDRWTRRHRDGAETAAAAKKQTKRRKFKPSFVSSWRINIKASFNVTLCAEDSSADSSAKVKP